MSNQKCSFCSKEQSQVAILITKPSVAICNECVPIKQNICENPEKYNECKQHEKCTFCSFMTDLYKMPNAFSWFLPDRIDSVRVVGGPETWICKQCLDLCDEIIDEQTQ